MGMYFGVRNVTKNTNVVSFWKGKPPSREKMSFMIEIFNWDVTDYIISGCYCECYEWEGDRWSYPIGYERVDEEENKKETDVQTFINFPDTEYEDYIKTDTIPVLTCKRLKELKKNVDTTYHFN